MDWIKLRIDVLEDPAVIKIARRTRLEDFAVLGRLVKVWGWADRQCTDGFAAGVDSAYIDRLVGHKGFAAAMEEVGWLCFDETGAHFPNFERHNGKSAKSRAQAAIRQQMHRSSDQNARN